MPRRSSDTQSATHHISPSQGEGSMKAGSPRDTSSAQAKFTKALKELAILLGKDGAITQIVAQFAPATETSGVVRSC
jgi:hypothetical protein